MEKTTKMADSVFVVNELLCFLCNKFDKATTKILLANFYNENELCVAKDRLREAASARELSA